MLRWLNDSSALAVFANPREAQAALDAGRGGHYKLRPFSEVRLEKLLGVHVGNPVCFVFERVQYLWSGVP